MSRSFYFRNITNAGWAYLYTHTPSVTNFALQCDYRITPNIYVSPFVPPIYQCDTTMNPPNRDTGGYIIPGDLGINNGMRIDPMSHYQLGMKFVISSGPKYLTSLWTSSGYDTSSYDSFCNDLAIYFNRVAQSDFLTTNILVMFDKLAGDMELILGSIYPNPEERWTWIFAYFGNTESADKIVTI